MIENKEITGKTAIPRIMEIISQGDEEEDIETIYNTAKKIFALMAKEENDDIKLIVGLSYKSKQDLLRLIKG